jgi:hypothetical protein
MHFNNKKLFVVSVNSLNVNRNDLVISLRTSQEAIYTRGKLQLYPLQANKFTALHF